MYVPSSIKSYDNYICVFFRQIFLFQHDNAFIKKILDYKFWGKNRLVV